MTQAECQDKLEGKVVRIWARTLTTYIEVESKLDDFTYKRLYKKVQTNEGEQFQFESLDYDYMSVKFEDIFFNQHYSPQLNAALAVD